MSLERVSAEQSSSVMSTHHTRPAAAKPSYAPDSEKINSIRDELKEMLQENDRKIQEAYKSGHIDAIKQLTKDKLSHYANDRVTLSTETFNENKDPAKVSSTVTKALSKITDALNDLDQRMTQLSSKIPELNQPTLGKISASKISGGSAPAA
jgi:prefoldin subunit 5